LTKLVGCDIIVISNKQELEMINPNSVIVKETSTRNTTVISFGYGSRNYAMSDFQSIKETYMGASVTISPKPENGRTWVTVTQTA